MSESVLRHRLGFPEILQCCSAMKCSAEATAREMARILVRTQDANRLAAFLQFLSHKLAPEVVRDIVREAIESLSGTEYAVLALLYSTQGESATSTLQLLHFVESHQTILPGVNVKQLLQDPWSQLRQHVTWYNYSQYLLVFSLCGLSMETVLFHLLEDVVAFSVVPEWSAVASFLLAFAEVSQPFRLAQCCLSLARRYAHDSVCSTHPCARCQDRMEAAGKALELCHAGLSKGCEDEESEEKEMEIDAKSRLTRECRVEYLCAVIHTQSSRLFHGASACSPSLLPLFAESAIRDHFASLQSYLESVFVRVACESGGALEKVYAETVFSLWRVMQRENEGENPRKRAANTHVVRDCKRRRFEVDAKTVTETRSALRERHAWMERSASETEMKRFVFNEEECGGVYLHSVMEVISDQCGYDYHDITLRAIEILLNTPIEEASLCELEKLEKQRVLGVAYLLEGFMEIDPHVFVSETTRLLTRVKSGSFPPFTKYLLCSAVAWMLEQFPPSCVEALLQNASKKERVVLDARELKTAARLYRIQENCQTFGIPVGGDILAQVRNQAFLGNTIRAHRKDVRVLWWIKRVVEEEGIEDVVLLKQLLLACVELEGSEEVKIRITRFVLERVGRERDVLCAVERVMNDMVLCDERVSRACCEDIVMICEEVKEWCGDKVQEEWSHLVGMLHEEDRELTQCLCDLVFAVMDEEKRVESLQTIVEKGNAFSVLPFVACEGHAMKKYRCVFESAAKKLMRDKQYDLLFYSDWYEEVVALGYEDEWVWKEWIVYHIKKRQFKDAMDMLVKLGWKEEAGLRDYVIEELKDESLLSYLLLFWGCLLEKNRLTNCQ